MRCVLTNVEYDRHQMFRVSFLRRAAAYGIDSAVVLSAWFVALVLVIIVERAVGARQEDDDAGPVLTAVFLVLLPLFWFVFQGACNALGISPGKRVMKLSIVRVPNAALVPFVVRPGIRVGLLRTFGQALGAIAFGLGFWWAL